MMKKSWNLIFKFVFGIRDWMTNIDNIISYMGKKLINKKKRKIEIWSCYGKLIINDNSICSLNYIFVNQLGFDMSWVSIISQSWES